MGTRVTPPISASQSRGIAGDTAWMFAGSVVYAACQWGIAVILARFGGPEVVGLFVLGSAISTPIIVVAQLGLRQVLITDFSARYDFADYLRLRLSMTVGAFASIVLLLLVLGYQRDALVALAAIAAGRCFESVSDIHYARMQRDERLEKVALFTMTRGVLCLVSVTVVYLTTLSVEAACIAFGAACAVSMIIVDGASERRQERVISFGPRERAKALSLAKTALPLAGSQFFSNLSGNVPRLMLQGLGGTRLLGLYAAIEYFIIAANLVVQAVGQAAAPRLARLFASGEFDAYLRLVRQLLAFFVSVGVAATVGMWVVGPDLLRLIYGPGFELPQSTIMALMAAATLGFAASVLGYAVTATGTFHGLTWRYATVALVSATSALLLTPLWGLSGLAAAIALGHIVGCALPAAFLIAAVAAARARVA